MVIACKQLSWIIYWNFTIVKTIFIINNPKIFHKKVEVFDSPWNGLFHRRFACDQILVLIYCRTSKGLKAELPFVEKVTKDSIFYRSEYRTGDLTNCTNHATTRSKHEQKLQKKNNHKHLPLSSLSLELIWYCFEAPSCDDSLGYEMLPLLNEIVEYWHCVVLVITSVYVTVVGVHTEVDVGVKDCTVDVAFTVEDFVEGEDTSNAGVVVVLVVLVETQRNCPCGNWVSLQFGSRRLSSNNIKIAVWLCKHFFSCCLYFINYQKWI